MLLKDVSSIEIVKNSNETYTILFDGDDVLKKQYKNIDDKIINGNLKIQNLNGEYENIDVFSYVN